MKKKFPPGSNQRNGGRGRGRCGGVDGRRGGCGGGGGSGTAGDRLERRSEHGLDDGRGQCLGVVAARRPHQRRRRQRRRRVHVEAVEEGAERGRFARRRRAARLRNQSVPTFSAQLVRLGNKSFVKKNCNKCVVYRRCGHSQGSRRVLQLLRLADFHGRGGRGRCRGHVHRRRCIGVGARGCRRGARFFVRVLRSKETANRSELGINSLKTRARASF